MSAETPPPVPQQPFMLPPQLPEPVNMVPRWIAWLVASIFMPALPWLMVNERSSDKEFQGVLAMTVLALLLQLGASIAVAMGFCKRRAIGVGGVIGMTVVFMLASVAIGTAIWFAVCATRIATDFK